MPSLPAVPNKLRSVGQAVATYLYYLDQAYFPRNIRIDGPSNVLPGWGSAELAANQ